MSAEEIQARLKKLGSKARAISSGRYFKTGPGQYGEGDIFLGLSAPSFEGWQKNYAEVRD